MASIKDLKVSWNFDNLETSDIAGNAIISDVSNNNNGIGQGFGSEDTSFITKEYIKTFTKRQLDSLENYDTIRVLEDDDERINQIQKPSSMQLILEKSMYQIMSDEMLNMFSNNQAYASRYLQPFNKFTEEYPLITESKKDFFSKIDNIPNLEKFLEFYKWLDSSLGYMLDQLKPESVNNISGLKNTVESHILERNKYKHQIPLTVEPSRVFSTSVVRFNENNKLSDIKSYILRTKQHTSEKVGTLQNNPEITSDITNSYSITNIKDKNYTKNYEFIQTSGKVLNPRAQKTSNKSIFRSSFSSVDGISDIKRDNTGEYSVNNSCLFKHSGVKEQLNKIYSSTGSNVQGIDSLSKFMDNGFISRNIPYTASCYTSHESRAFPKEEVVYRRLTNTLSDIYKNSYDESYDITEPPIQFCQPTSHKLKTKNGSSEIEILSPYNSAIDTFSKRNELKLSEKLSTVYLPTIKNIKNPAKDTFFNTLSELPSGSIDLNRLELLNLVFPRTDLIGLARIRTKFQYEEAALGKDFTYDDPNILQSSSIEYDRNFPWAHEQEYTSYDNPSHIIRTFWRDSENDRRRTRGADYTQANGIPPNNLNDRVGSYNCYGYGNAYNAIKNSQYKYDSNIYNSMYTMDSNVPVQYSSSENEIILSCSAETYGDLAPYSHFQRAILLGFKDLSIQPKPEFIHNLFLDKASVQSQADVKYVFNKSYQDGINCNIKPFYNSYDEFRQNIKNKSQSYSILPEFIVSNFPKTIKSEGGEDKYYYKDSNNEIVPLYLTLKGKQYYPDIDRESFKFDLNKFIDKKSNKIKIKIKAIKKILPYNGFYPQQRTMQIAGIFNDVYLRDADLVKDINKIYIDSTDYEKGVKLTLAATQAFFAPGILFNTIKSGIAMNWPVPTDGSAAKTGENNVFSVDLTNCKKINFESILKPETISSSQQINKLYYMDPTHYSSNIINKLGLTPNSTYEFDTSNFNNAVENSVVYKSAINNFFSEVINFFLKDKKLTSFKTAPIKDDTNIAVIPGYKYYMDIVIEKKQNFSMFNGYIDQNNKNYALIPSASLFGPPVNSLDNTSFRSYYPYAPPYYRADSKSTLRVSYTVPAASSSVRIGDIVQNLDMEDIDSDTDSISFQKKMSLGDCLNIGKATDGSFIVETKLEMPLINFNGCYDIISSSL